MMTAIIKSYANFLLLISALCFGLLCLGLFFIFRANGVLKKKSKQIDKPIAVQPSNLIQAIDLKVSHADFTAIAGDDIIATQLDLARAFIETGNNKSAKKILEDIASQGSIAQQNEAKELLSRTL